MPNISYEDWVDRGRTLAQLWRFAGHIGQCQRVYVHLVLLPTLSVGDYFETRINPYTCSFGVADICTAT